MPGRRGNGRRYAANKQAKQGAKNQPNLLDTDPCGMHGGAIYPVGQHPQQVQQQQVQFPVPPQQPVPTQQPPHHQAQQQHPPGPPTWYPQAVAQQAQQPPQPVNMIIGNDESGGNIVAEVIHGDVYLPQPLQPLPDVCGEAEAGEDGDGSAADYYSGGEGGDDSSAGDDELPPLCEDEEEVVVPVAAAAATPGEDDSA